MRRIIGWGVVLCGLFGPVPAWGVIDIVLGTPNVFHISVFDTMDPGNGITGLTSASLTAKIKCGNDDPITLTYTLEEIGGGDYTITSSTPTISPPLESVCAVWVEGAGSLVPIGGQPLIAYHPTLYKIVGARIDQIGQQVLAGSTKLYTTTDGDVRVGAYAPNQAPVGVTDNPALDPAEIGDGALITELGGVYGTLSAGSTSTSLVSAAFSAPQATAYVGMTVIVNGVSGIVQTFNPATDTVTTQASVGSVNTGDTIYVLPTSLYRILYHAVTR